MNKTSMCAAAAVVLVLLAGCASKTPTEPVAEPVPETPVLEAREAYQLAEIPVQELHDGDEVTVDGVCTFTVKGFGAGRTITADGLTCAGAKAGQTLVWVTCDYVNLTQDEVSPGRLVENAVLRLESGSVDGKSASFAQILHGEPAEIYIYYAIPEDLPEQSLTTQFTIDGQTYSYAFPANRAGALPPTLPEPEEPEAEPEPKPITLQEPPKQETPAQQEQPKTEETTVAKEETENKIEAPEVAEEAAASKTDLIETTDGFLSYEKDSAGKTIKQYSYNKNKECYAYEIYKYNSAGKLINIFLYAGDGTWVQTLTYDGKGHIIKYEQPDGSSLTYVLNERYDPVKRYRRGPRYGNYDEEYEYDASGAFLRMKVYNLDGTLYRTQYYVDGKMVSEYPDGRIEYPDGSWKN